MASIKTLSLGTGLPSHGGPRQGDYGIHAIASPVFGPSGKLVGSILVMGTFPRQLSQKYGSQVAEMARGFSKTIGGMFQVPHPKNNRAEKY